MTNLEKSGLRGKGSLGEGEAGDKKRDEARDRVKWNIRAVEVMPEILEAKTIDELYQKAKYVFPELPDDQKLASPSYYYLGEFPPGINLEGKKALMLSRYLKGVAASTKEGGRLGAQRFVDRFYTIQEAILSGVKRKTKKE